MRRVPAAWDRGAPGRHVLRYGASVAGVGAVTWIISLVLPHYHVGNISMVFLLLVLALAVFAGSGPAILASVLAFLAFDWFFVPPVGHITVSDPDEWLALFLFLVVAMITGQLAAGLRRRAQEARRRARETQTLYELSMAILADTHFEHVLQIISERLISTLHLQSASIWIVAEDGTLARVAAAGEELDEPSRAAVESGVRWAFDSARAAGEESYADTVRVIGPLATTERHRAGGGLAIAYVPILLGQERLGIIAARGRSTGDVPSGERVRLMEAFAAQIALAAGRTRLAAEEERSRAAAESDRLKSTFLASISHDLRTPLTAIKAAAAGLQNGTLQAGQERWGSAHQELAASIDREVDRLNRLVGNLLEMSRIEAGGLPPRKAPEDFAELVGTVLGRLTPQLGDRHFTARIAPDEPLVPLDAGQIDRVLTNLLENAIKFSPANGRIILEAKAEERALRVSMYNDGARLTERDRVRIFDKFYRLEPPATANRGTGLGLSICKGIVEAHGGRIWAENDAAGVRVAFTLPLAEAPPRDPLPAETRV